MSLTLLVENNPKIESFYTLNLYTWLGLETLTQTSAKNAISYLESGEVHVKLIIVRALINKETSAKDLMLYLKEKGLHIPVVVVGPGATEATCPEAYAYLPNSLQIKPLIQSVSKALNITAKEMSTKVVPDFFPIPINYFKGLKRPICDVFFLDEAENKYHLRLPKSKNFEQKSIDEMIKDGMKYLYVDKLSRLDFVNNVSSELMTELSSKDLSKDELISAADKSMELLSTKLLDLGISEETIAIAKKNIEIMRSNTKSHAKLSSLIDRLLSNKASYLYKHTQILTYVALHIMKNVDWGTPEQEDKICFIAFFHDIVLQSDVHAMIKNSVELKKANLNVSDKQLVEKHAQMAAEYVQKFPHAPMGADQIIRQHHGVLNGIGFSDHFGATVTPIAVVFVVAEEFTRILLKYEQGPFEKAEMLRELKEEFPTTRFQKVVETLQDLAL